MDERDDRLMTEDAEFERLFSSLGEIRASDELKEATLAGIFARMEEEEAEEHAASERRLEKAQLTVVEGGAHHADDETAPMREASAEKATAHGRHLVKSDERPAKRERKPRLRLRVAAGLIAAAVALGGGVAYATPVTHVLTVSGDTTFDLGVNMFGVTVTAEADSDDGKEVLEGLSLRNVRFEDAYDRLLGACDDTDDGNMQVTVEGHGPLGDREGIAERANDIAQSHRRTGGASESGGAGTAQGSGKETSSASQQPENAGGQANGEAGSATDGGGAKPQGDTGQEQGRDTSAEGERSQTGQQPDGGTTPVDTGQQGQSSPQQDQPQGQGPGEGQNGPDSGGAPGQGGMPR